MLQFDETSCRISGCDQGLHNVLYHNGTLTDTVGIREIYSVEHGKGNVLNLAVLRSKPLREWGIYDPDKQLLLNWDKVVAPVVHQYDRDSEVSQMMKNRKASFGKEWKNVQASGR